MSSNKKHHIIENQDIEISEDDLSGEEESDEGEQISAGNEVNWNLRFCHAGEIYFMILGNSSGLRRTQSN